MNRARLLAAVGTLAGLLLVVAPVLAVDVLQSSGGAFSQSGSTQYGETTSWAVAAGTTLRVTAQVTAIGTNGAIAMKFQGGCTGGDQYVGGGNATVGANSYTITVPAGCTNGRVYWYGIISGSSWAVYRVDPDPSPSPTPTPAPTPTPTPSPTPVATALELVQADRDRLDGIGATLGFGVVVLSFLGSAVFVSSGLRRG